MRLQSTNHGPQQLEAETTPMTEVAQELMTPHEAARWFRRSPSWLRQQAKLLRVGGPGGQPLYHVRVCRAYVLGRLCGLDDAELQQIQTQALAAACGLDQDARFRAATANAAHAT